MSTGGQGGHGRQLEGQDGLMGKTGRQGAARRAGRAGCAVIDLPVIQPGRTGASRGQPPIFQKIGIVGLGLIGGSIALAAREIWPASLVIGVDNKDVLETAMRLHAIDVAADDPIVLAEVDLVILAAPVRTNIELLRELDDHVHQPAVVTDTGSTKRAVVEAARALPPKFTFIGGHPLGGGAKGGLENARPDLFKGRPWLLTPTGESGEAFERLSAFVGALGAEPRALDAADSRSRAGVSEPSAAVDGQRADAGGRRCRGAGRPGARRPRTGRHDAAGVELRPKSGATSPRPTPTRLGRRSTC